MPKSLRSRASLLLPLAFLGGACAPKNPPALPVPEVRPLVIPMPTAPKDANLFGYVKIRDVKQTLDLFGGAILSSAADQGLNLAEIQAGKPAAVFTWDLFSARTPQESPTVALLPVPAEGTLASRLKGMAESIVVEPMGDVALAAMNSEAAARAQEQHEALLEVLQAPIPFDGLLYINAATILDKYLPKIREGITALGPMLALAAQQRPDSPSPKAAMGMLESFVKSFETLRAVAVGVKPYDGGLEFSSLIQDRQPTPGGPIAAPDLAQFLPPADIRLEWNSRDLKRFVDFYMRAYAPFLDEKPALRAQIEPLIAEWMKVGRKMDSAVNFQFGGEKGLSSAGLLRCDDPAGMMLLFSKVLQLFESGPVHDIYKSMGVDFHFVHKPKIRKLKGWPVDRYEYRLTLGPELVEPTTRALWEKLAGASYEVARIGPYIAFATNSSLDEVVNGLFAGKGLYPLKATSAFPAGGELYVDINVPALLAGVKNMMPPHLAGQMPTLPPQPDLITFFGYDSGEIGYYKLRLPGPMLAALRSPSARAPSGPPPGAPPN